MTRSSRATLLPSPGGDVRQQPGVLAARLAALRPDQAAAALQQRAEVLGHHQGAECVHLERLLEVDE